MLRAHETEQEYNQCEDSLNGLDCSACDGYREEHGECNDSCCCDYCMALSEYATEKPEHSLDEIDAYRRGLWNYAERRFNGSIGTYLTWLGYHHGTYQQNIQRQIIWRTYYAGMQKSREL